MQNWCGPANAKLPCRLKVGVDLGTANTVLAVVDSNNRPIAGASAPSHAIRDGVIVNYYESVQLVTKLKMSLKKNSARSFSTVPQRSLQEFPRAVSKASAMSSKGAGFEVTNIVDEPTAASAVLKITDGAVVDVGGGTTGISILKDGKVIYTDDEATGGSHMTMTVAGHYKIPYEDAEVLKTDPEKEAEIFLLSRLLLRRWQQSPKDFSRDMSPCGLRRRRFCQLQRIHDRIREETQLPVYRPVHPLLVTPLGIATTASCRR